MVIRLFIVCCIAVVYSLPGTAAIYKSVDENGNVVFSDSPPDKNAEEVEIGPINTIPAPEVTPRPSTTDEEQEAVEEVYSVTITAPQHDEAIRSNNGDIEISLSVEPALAVEIGDQLVVKLDNEEVSRGTDVSVQLSNISRGTHTLSAQIENELGEVRASAEEIQFHVQRVTILNQFSPPQPVVFNDPVR